MMRQKFYFLLIFCFLELAITITAKNTTVPVNRSPFAVCIDDSDCQKLDQGDKYACFKFFCYPWKNDAEIAAKDKIPLCRKEKDCKDGKRCYRHEDRRRVPTGICLDQMIDCGIEGEYGNCPDGQGCCGSYCCEDKYYKQYSELPCSNNQGCKDLGLGKFCCPRNGDTSICCDVDPNLPPSTIAPINDGGDQTSCALKDAFKAGAKKFVTVRRSSRRGAKNKGEILWQPQDMLRDPTCYAVQAAELEMRQEGVNQWSIAKVETKPHGKAIKWTVKIKPCLKYYFRIKVTGNDTNSDSTSFELPPSLAIEPMSQENILKSGYTPDAPTGFKFEVSSADADLRWNPSDCATNYEISYLEAGGGSDSKVKSTGKITSGRVSNLKPCTRYDTVISAILGDEYGDLSTEFATEPRLDAATDLDVKTTPGLDSVHISWPAWQEVSCIDKYKVKACIADTGVCTEEEIVQKFVGSPFVNHKLTGLKPCTDYKLRIQPIFEDLNIDVKEVELRTNSMDATQQCKTTTERDTTTENLTISDITEGSSDSQDMTTLVAIIPDTTTVKAMSRKDATPITTQQPILTTETEDGEISDAEPIIIALSVSIVILAIPAILAVRAWCIRGKGMKGEKGNKDSTEQGNATKVGEDNEEEGLTTNGDQEKAGTDT